MDKKTLRISEARKHALEVARKMEKDWQGYFERNEEYWGILGGEQGE